MKRSWMGFVLLIALLVAGLVSSAAMLKFCSEDTARLERAGEEALRGNWERAAYFTAQARQSWDSWELFRCAMADHKPAEEIDTLFSMLEVYGSARDKVNFGAICREAAKKLETLGDAQRLNLRNLL